ncbi:MAG: tRNA lysidine(34) synthetase TilS [Sphingomonadales bacterium 12-68-11]|nr:MAG: tRNA lysidine(34) synthetase TilS [Sphingomonadales bacterium 12-68-11]
MIDLAARFAEQLEQVWPAGEDPGSRLGLAVSGGPDSLALLLLAHAIIPGRFEVATIDHGLRRESTDECAMVERVCAERGIPCEVLKVIVPQGNVQAKARNARYHALGRWAERQYLTAIATAHHADDQAETLLMRLNRGSGVAGLAGVRATGVTSLTPLPVVRPLLTFRRAELAEVVAASGLVAVQDPSNADDRFDRARIRKELAHCDWLDPIALAESAAHLADADAALTFYANTTWRKGVQVTDDEVVVPILSLREIALRVVGRAIGHFGGDPRGQDLARLVARLEAGEGGNVAGVLATVEGGHWVFRREPARRTG